MLQNNWACTDNRLAAIAPFYGPHPSRGRRSAACARSWGRGRARLSPAPLTAAATVT